MKSKKFRIRISVGDCRTLTKIKKQTNNGADVKRKDEEMYFSGTNLSTHISSFYFT